MNSKKKCRGCSLRLNSNDMISVPLGYYHSFDCMLAHTNKKRANVTAKRRRAENKEAKEKIRTRSEWYDILQALVNQYVNHVRDDGKPCCTCGKTSNVKYDAGHFRTRGSCPELRFELKNIHRQCSVNCNQHGAGMRAEYRVFIVKEYGQETLEWLEGPHKSLKEQFPHYTDIKEEIIRYRKLIREHGLKPVR